MLPRDIGIAPPQSATFEKCEQKGNQKDKDKHKLLSANALIKDIQFSGRARHLIHLNNLLKLYIGTAVSIKTILELV